MGRVIWGVLACLGVSLVLVQSAAAASVSVTPTVNGDTISVTVSGWADPCDQNAGCSSQAVQVQVWPDYQGACFPPTDPQASFSLPASGGQFRFTSSVTVQGGQAYEICGYVMTTASGNTSESAFSEAPTVWVPPEPCPAGTVHLLGLNAPPLVSYGRRARVAVLSTSSQGIMSGSLTMSELSGGPAFYSHAFTGQEMYVLHGDNERVTFPIVLKRGDGPAQVVLSYVLVEPRSGPFFAECRDTLTATVAPVAGHIPVAALVALLPNDPNGSGVRFSASGGCVVTRPVPAVITISGRDANSTTSTRDECTGAWRTHGRAPGISVSRSMNATGSTVEFHATGRLNRTYRLAVRIAGRVVDRARLRTSFTRTSRKRIYAGSDEFASFCVDQNQTLYSLHNRLFCWKPASTYHSVSLIPINARGLL